MGLAYDDDEEDDVVLAQTPETARRGWAALFPQGTRAYNLLESVALVLDADTMDQQGRPVQKEPTAKDLSMLRSLLHEIKSFSGDATGTSEFINWAEEFHDQLDTCGNTRRVMALKMKLCGTAKKLWMGLPSRTRWSYRESMVELCRYYIIDAEEDEPEADFWARKQKENETAAQFLVVLRILVNRIPRMSRTGKERILRIQFRRGLKLKWNGAIHTAFRTKAPDPIELVRMITRLEKDERGRVCGQSSSESEEDDDEEATTSRKVPKPAKPITQQPAQEQQLAQPHNQGQRWQGQQQPRGQQRWQGPWGNWNKQQQPWHESRQNWNQNPRPHRNGNRSQQNWNRGPPSWNQSYSCGRQWNHQQSSSGPRRCYQCDEEGHFARNCPLWYHFLAQMKQQKQLETSKNAEEAMDLAIMQEQTRQLELQARIREYELGIEQMKMEQCRVMEEERRKTLIEESKQTRATADYQDQLAGKRLQEELAAKQRMEEDSLRKQEESVKKQEALRRATIEHELQLKHKYETDRLMAEAKARSVAEQESKETRDNEHHVTIMEAIVFLLAVSLYTTNRGTGATAQCIEARRKPRVVGETPRTTPIQALKHLMMTSQQIVTQPKDPQEAELLFPSTETTFRATNRSHQVFASACMPAGGRQ